MEYIGKPFAIQNTDGTHWLVRWDEAVTTDPMGESISFTVAIPRSANLTLAEVQRYAMKRAVEMLQDVIRESAPPSP